MRTLLTFIALIATVAPASAVNFDFTFIVTPGGPAGTVVGSFSGSYTPGPGLDVSTLSSVNLTINGFTYSTGNTLLEVTNGTDAGLGFFKLGGALSGINALSSGTNDFMVYVENRATGVRPITFAYTTAGSNSFFNTPNFIAFRTPDGGSAGLLLGAVCIILGMTRGYRGASTRRE
jgi:hypothetical protein